jgi:hypothetical protein
LKHEIKLFRHKKKGGHPPILYINPKQLFISPNTQRFADIFRPEKMDQPMHQFELEEWVSKDAWLVDWVFLELRLLLCHRVQYYQGEQ